MDFPYKKVIFYLVILPFLLGNFVSLNDKPAIIEALKGLTYQNLGDLAINL